MAVREGSDRPLKAEAANLLPLSTSQTFSWLEYKTWLMIHVATINLGTEVITTNFALVAENDLQKAARILKYAKANAAVVSAICKSAFGCAEARIVVTQHHTTDPDKNAYNLFKMIEA